MSTCRKVKKKKANQRNGCHRVTAVVVFPSSPVRRALLVAVRVRKMKNVSTSWVGSRSAISDFIKGSVREKPEENPVDISLYFVVICTSA